MKGFFLLLSLLLSTSLFAQINEKIFLKENYTVHILFPENVSFYTLGGNSNSIDIQQVDNSLFIQPYEKLQNETNLIVKTETNSFYNFILAYNNQINKYEYIIQNQDLEKKKSDTNNYSQQINYLLDQENILNSRNLVKNKKLIFLIKGIWIHDQNLFFKFELQNKSHLDLFIEEINFNVENRSKKKNVSIYNEVKIPIHTNFKTKSIAAKRNRSFVYVFPQFTIGLDKSFNVHIREKSGERNLTLRLSPELILDAKPLYYE
ncbi:DUF4138 domain-containing protein [Aureivirga sp. CE67]|uniref:DUF4138 domain-containing protein n=1 Tax=Aureivirga sp. CE67 TaxID=1788983 RepID=UPI0018CBBE16|nr:DUF4138 domain-containing protein [Aureivirga sp. CE67]